MIKIKRNNIKFLNSRIKEMYSLKMYKIKRNKKKYIKEFQLFLI